MALGGGGSTYINDYQANFYNPANLMIKDHPGSFDIGVAVGGIYFDPVLNYRGLQDQFHNLKDYIQSYDPSSYTLTPKMRNQILEQDFKPGASISSNQSRYDITLLGLKWENKNSAISLAFRSRTSSKYTTGKEWYTDYISAVNGIETMDRTLTHRYQTLHEISFGYAESFPFLSGLTPRLDKFIIGIAPKLVFGGGYLDASWTNIYERSIISGEINRIQSLNYSATGNFGAAVSDYNVGMDARQAVSNNFDYDASSIYGIGAGLDIGVTYLLTLGDDLSAIHSGNELTRKSLRVSFSMTDIGFISYSQDEVTIDSPQDTTLVEAFPAQLAQEPFMGIQGQYLNFIEAYGEDNPLKSSNRITDTFSTLLPLALHGGIMLDLNRIKLMSDLSIGLTKNAFNSTTLISSFGIELRPLKFMPLRAGIQLESSEVNFLSVGTGIESRYWDFSVAAQLSPEPLPSFGAVSGFSMATLRFHF